MDICLDTLPLNTGKVTLLHRGLQAPQDRRNDTSSVDEGSEILTSDPGTRI
jgi:hypothetical protein